MAKRESVDMAQLLSGLLQRQVSDLVVSIAEELRRFGKNVDWDARLYEIVAESCAKKAEMFRALTDDRKRKSSGKTGRGVSKG